MSDIPQDESMTSPKNWTLLQKAAFGLVAIGGALGILLGGGSIVVSRSTAQATEIPSSAVSRSDVRQISTETAEAVLKRYEDGQLMVRTAEKLYLDERFRNIDRQFQDIKNLLQPAR